MIGNDIIDLNIAREKNPLRPRFLNKVFTPHEQEYIIKDSNPAKKAWLLWTMKESAYKAHQRKFGLARNFNPHSLQCIIFSQTLASASGEVRINGNNYRITGDINPNYIHTCAIALPEKQKMEWVIIPSSEDLKKEFLLRISRSYGWDLKSVGIGKNNNSIPEITLNKRVAPIAFSLSHHGEFAAFSFELMNY